MLTIISNTDVCVCVCVCVCVSIVVNTYLSFQALGITKKVLKDGGTFVAKVHTHLTTPHVFVSVRTYVHLYVYTCAYICFYIHMFFRMYIHMYVHI